MWKFDRKPYECDSYWTTLNVLKQDYALPGFWKSSCFKEIWRTEINVCDRFRLRRWHKESNGPEGDRGDHGRCGNGKYPCPDNALGHSPANGGKARGGTYSNNGAGDGVRGTDRNTVIGEHEKRGSARAFSAESANGTEFGNF